MPERAIKCLRVVVGAWLFGWFCKFPFYMPYLFKTVWETPIRSDFFPALLENNAVSAFFYILPALCVPAFFSKKWSLYRLGGWIMLFSAVILNLHLNTHNDATFVTSFWVALWILWFVEAMRKGGPSLERRACFLAQLTIGMIFLGGAVGKLTADYLSGDVIYYIFYVQAKTSFLSYFVKSSSFLTQKAIFAMISKFIIGAEMVLAANFLLPFRVSFYLGLALMPLLIFFSTWRILSVIGALLGLLVGCLILDRQRNEEFA